MTPSLLPSTFLRDEESTSHSWSHFYYENHSPLRQTENNGEISFPIAFCTQYISGLQYFHALPALVSSQSLCLVSLERWTRYLKLVGIWQKRRKAKNKREMLFGRRCMLWSVWFGRGQWLQWEIANRLSEELVVLRQAGSAEVELRPLLRYWPSTFFHSPPWTLGNSSLTPGAASLCGERRKGAWERTKDGYYFHSNFLDWNLETNANWLKWTQKHWWSWTHAGLMLAFKSQPQFSLFSASTVNISEPSVKYLVVMGWGGGGTQRSETKLAGCRPWLHLSAPGPLPVVVKSLESGITTGLASLLHHLAAKLCLSFRVFIS